MLCPVGTPAGLFAPARWSFWRAASAARIAAAVESISSIESLPVWCGNRRIANGEADASLPPQSSVNPPHPTRQRRGYGVTASIRASGRAAAQGHQRCSDGRDGACQLRCQTARRAALVT